jgi:hypothetical protein
MSRQEKKYRVESHAAITAELDKLAQKGETSTSTHYYAMQPNSNDAVKLVEHGESAAIHMLKAQDGKFTLVKNIPVESIDAGLAWLKENGHTKLGVVTMVHTDYAYKGGLIGLYTIDNFLYSVILEFKSGQHPAVESELGLENAEVIAVPYNKALRLLGKLRTMML